MNAKKLTVLAVLVAILAGAAVFKGAWTRKQDAALEKEASSLALPVLPAEIVPAQVERVEIGSGAAAAPSIVLEKKPTGEWTLPSHFGTRGAGWSVEDLLKTVSGLKGEVRSDKPGVLGDFEIDDARAVRIAFFGAGKKQIAALLVSPLRPFGTQNFVRAAGSDRVHATSSDVLGSLGIYEKNAAPDYRVFAHQQAVKFDLSQAFKFSLTQPNGSPLTLVKKEKEDKTVFWEFEPADKSEIDPAKASGYLGTAVNFYGQEPVDPAGDHGWGAKPALTVWYGDRANPSSVELFVGKTSADKSVAIKAMPENLAWRVPADSLDTLKKEKSYFLKSASPA